MGEVFHAVPAGMEAFAAVEEATAAAICAVGAADSAAMLGAAAAAIGPFGAIYLAAYGPAQANNLAGTLLVGGVHAGIGGATQAAEAAFVQQDNS
jgi:hypothetical protein